MATEQEKQQSSPSRERRRVPGGDTLTVTDNRTGKTYELDDHRRDRSGRWTCARSRSPRTTSG